MRAWWLSCICACNSVYGLDRTQLADAPAPDAPPRCTTDGAPVFSPQITQAVFQSCRDYTISGDRAFAKCGYFDSVMGEGPIDGPLELVTLAPPAGTTIAAPRLTPDGDLVVHHRPLSGTAALVVSVYRRGDSWTWSHDIFTLTYFDRAGMPSRGPRRHIMLALAGSSFEEAVEESDGTWRRTAYPYSALGVDGVAGAIHLSADGLRAVFSTDAEVRYAVRTSIDMPFAGSDPLAVPVSPAYDAFLTEDCSRVYFSGLDSVFYAFQQ